MKNNNMPILSAIFAIIISITLALTFYFSSYVYTKNENKIILPTEMSPAEIIPNTGVLAKNNQTDIEIDTQNIYKIIESMERPKEYTSRAEITTYFGSDSSIVREFISYNKKGFSRIDSIKKNGEIDFTNIIADEKVFSIKGNDFKEFPKGEFSADDYQLIPTYENIARDIKSVDFIDYLGEPSISITSENEKNIISTITGLLVYSEYYKNDKITRKVNINSVKIENVDDNLFVLPNGNALLLP